MCKYLIESNSSVHIVHKAAENNNEKIPINEMNKNNYFSKNTYNNFIIKFFIVHNNLLYDDKITQFSIVKNVVIKGL